MSFIFNGVSSDTMKFNVTSRQVYNAPAYDLNAIEVPGRSGDLLNPQNRFKNKQVSYTGFLKASDFEGSTWREKISTGLIQLKGWLCSDAGTYHELTDDYDPGFTRYGYISGETAISDVQDRPFGVTLTVTFNCKPFMYKAGEPMELPETKSASGSIITITDGAENTPLKSAVVNIEPVQDLHGYDYPWPAGGGVNMAHLSDGSRTGQGCTGTVSSEVISVSGTASATYVNVTYFNDINIVSGQSYTVRLSKALTVDITFRFATDTTDTTYQQVSVNAGYTSAVFTANNNFAKYRIYVSGVTSETVINVSGLQIFVGQGTISEFSPYSNVCPISGWTQANVWVKPTYDTTLTPTDTIPLGRTVYGGTLDVLNGKLSVTEALLTLNTANMNNSEAFPGWVNSGVRQYVGAGINAVYNSMLNVGNTFSVNTTSTYDILYLSAQSYGKTQTEWKALAIDVQMIVPLAIPLEYDVTPQTIKTLLGVNNVWSDAGEMSIEYPIPAENPYPFGSRPLYEITMAGTGTLVVNGREWTITDYTGTLYCDTEAMEWYDASQLRNNIVSGDGWPVFEAGENSVSYTGDITKVMVTPRWRTL